MMSQNMVDLGISLAYPHFYVRNSAGSQEGLRARMGFTNVTEGAVPSALGTNSAVSRQGAINVVMTASPKRIEPDDALSTSRSCLCSTPRSAMVRSETVAHHADDCVSPFVARHDIGVADVALHVRSAADVYEWATRHGARPLCEPHMCQGALVAVVGGAGDLVHTLIERRQPGTLVVPGVGVFDDEIVMSPSGLRDIDHFAMCVPMGHLDSTVRFYREAFQMHEIHKERIDVGRASMDSMVLQSIDGTWTVTFVAPASEHPSQIHDFIDSHGGPGIQHIAYRTDDIVGSVDSLQRKGVQFSHTPDAYYTDLASWHTLDEHHVLDELRRLGILVDRDHGGFLFQVFTMSSHPRGTYFSEIIERDGAEGFGSGNIKALFQAKELERSAPASGPHPTGPHYPERFVPTSRSHEALPAAPKRPRRPRL